MKKNQGDKIPVFSRKKTRKNKMDSSTTHLLVDGLCYKME